MTLLGIDYAIVVAYLAGMLVVGGYLSRKIGTSQEYFLAGRSLPFWAIGVSVVASDIGATDMVGVGGNAFRYGISVANFDWIGSFPAMIVASFVFIAYFWRAGVYTIPEFLGRRYNDGVRSVQVLIWLLYMALNLGVIFYSAGLYLEEIMGWPYWVGVGVTAVVIGAYSVSGGLTAIVLTDVIQVTIMFVGCLAIVVLGVWEAGGLLALKEKVLALGPAYGEHFDLLLPAETRKPAPWTGILFGLAMVMAPAYFIGNQTIVQRTLAAKNEWHAKASMLVGALLKACVPVLVATPGLIALALYRDEVKDPDQSFAVLIRRLLPPGMAGLLFAAFLAAIMTNLDSILNSAATLFTKDIYQRFLRPAAGDAEILRTGRIVSLLTLIAGVAASPVTERFEGVYVFSQTLLSLFQGPTFAILLLGIVWARCTPAAGLAGLLAGLAAAALMHANADRLFTIEEPFLYVSFWSFAFTAATCALVSAFTRPHPEERLRGLVYGLVVRDPAPEAGAGEGSRA